MKSTSSALRTAIDAMDRPLLARQVRIDWQNDGGFLNAIDDVTLDVVRLEIKRALTTDLPPQVKRFTGVQSAEGTITLKHIDYADETKHAGWYYSPFNVAGDPRGASPIGALDPTGKNMYAEVGFNGTSGEERLRRITGQIIGQQLDGLDRVNVFGVTDTLALQEDITLPMILADDRTFGSPAKKPGLRATFLVDWVLRQCGYFASPPARSNCKLMATLAGSGWPEIGTIQEFRGANYTELAFHPKDPSFNLAVPFIHAVATSGISSQQIDWTFGGSPASLNPNNGGTVFYEGWHYFDDIAGGSAASPCIAYQTGTTNPFIGLFVDTTGRLQTLVNRAGTDATNRSSGTATPTGMITTGTWYYIGSYWRFNNGSIDWTCRVAPFGGSGTTYGPFSIVAGSTTSSDLCNTASLRGRAGGFALADFDGMTSSVQWTSENFGNGTSVTWNDGFTPSAVIMPSMNRLMATPVMSEKALAILGEIARAEMGFFRMTEEGMPEFNTLDFWTTPPRTSVQYTLKTTTKVKATSLDRDIAAVRNKIVLKGSRVRILGVQDVFSLEDYIFVAANASRTWDFNVTNPAAYLDGSFSTGTGATGSRYNASTVKNGGGSAITNLSISVAMVSATRIRIIVTNPNGFAAWLVGNTGISGVSQGIPSLKVQGTAVVFDAQENSALAQEFSDATSIANYEEQLLEIASDFIQRLDYMDDFGPEILAELKDPKAILVDMPIVGDPSVELGDRVNVEDPEGLSLDVDFHLAAVTEVLDSAGYSMTASFRSV